MLEIEKIKSFIELHNGTFAFEVFRQGGWMENATCEIKNSNTKNPMLTVYYVENGEEKELFSVCESYFKVPRKNVLQKRIAEYESGNFDDGICYHWCIHVLKSGEGQLIVDYLSVQNYLRSIEIFKKYK